jgi:hypothetical protein
MTEKFKYYLVDNKMKRERDEEGGDRRSSPARSPEAREYPKKIVFVVKRGRQKRPFRVVVKSEENESDLFELLYKHNIKFRSVEQVPDTYELEMDEMVAP